jgi:glycosyltransferase involved in cell wall biosynthesis
VAGAPARVLFVHSSSGRYGADRQLALIVSRLEREQFEPLVLLPAEGPLADDLRALGVEVIARPLTVLRRELLNPRGIAALLAGARRDAAELAELVRGRRIALVHSNTSVVLSGAVAAARARIPHVWHVREIYSRFGALWPVYRRVLERASALPCVSAATAGQFTPSPRVSVVHDGLAVEPARAPRAQARAALGVDPELPAIAVLGRISEWKGQDVLVRALAQPPLAERGALALIAGDAWPGTEHRTRRLLELADSLGVRDRLLLVGFRDDVENVLGAAELVAVPSSSPDPLPGAAIEAAAAGCAVIASAHGGLPEVIRDGETGLLVRPGDAAALADAAAQLLDDPALAARLGSAAARDVRKRFSAARLHDAIAELYASVLTA